MRSRADRSAKVFICFSLLVTLVSLGLLAGCGKEKTPTNTPPPAIVIGISPFTTTVAHGATQTFTATVTNTTNTGVTWSVDEANGGSITNAGVYTPPTGLGTFHVTVTSQADNTKKATATVTVVDSTVVTVTPDTATVAINAQQTFTAAVTDVTDTSVTWKVQEEAGGTIDAETGVYTAPNKAGTYHVVATSVEHSAKSGTAAITVTAPAPTFTTAAPTTAAEAEVYTYTPAATDPAGGTVEFALLGKPEGAKLEEGVLTWTPAKEQSRIENSFSVQVISSEGGTAVQEWTVTPTGIIRGQMIANHLHAAGVSGVPVDLTNYDIYAYVPAEDGTLTELEGTGTPEGTFEIPGVAGGKYWLSVLNYNVSEAEVVTCGGGQVLTDRSDIDLSCFVQGRSDVEYASEGTQRHFQIQGINPWQENDYIEFSVPNAREWDGWYGLVPDSISYDGLRSAYHLASGDAGILGQWTSAVSTGGRPYGLLTKVLNIADVTDTDADTTTISGAMQNVAGTHAFDATIAGTEFKKLNAAINPNTITNGSELYIETHPFGLSHGYVDYGPGLFGFSAWGEDESNPPVDDDVYLGQFTYGNPFPSTWPLIAEYWHDTLTSYNVSGSSMQIGTSYYQFTDALPTLAAPVKPILGPATEISVDETSFFDGGEVSATPTITWKAPALGTAQGYDLFLLQVSDGIYEDFAFRTTDTSVTVPAGVLQPGVNYMFAIRALNETGQDLAATPFMMGFPRAGAWATSGIFTVAAPVTPAARTAMARKLSGFKAMHKLTKSLGNSRRQLHKPVR